MRVGARRPGLTTVIIDDPGQAAVFLSSGVDLFEVNAVDQTPSSWILQDDVVSCRPTLLMATRIDPLLIALPLLQRGRQHVGACTPPATRPPS